MKPSIHVTVSLIGSIAVMVVTGSWIAAIVSCVSGVLVDLDHVWDFIRVRGRWTTLSDFFEFWNTFKHETLYLPFHGWEYILLLGGLMGLGIAPAVTGGLAFGLVHHLILDHSGNGIRPWGYFILVRRHWAFRSEKIFVNWAEIKARAGRPTQQKQSL